MIALTLTLAATVGLTLYAVYTKKDFTTCGALFFVLGMISLALLFLFFMFGGLGTGFYTVYCCFGVIL